MSVDLLVDIVPDPVGLTELLSVDGRHPTGEDFGIGRIAVPLLILDA